jgi:hypothetical protein
MVCVKKEVLRSCADQSRGRGRIRVSESCPWLPPAPSLQNPWRATAIIGAAAIRCSRLRICVAPRCERAPLPAVLATQSLQSCAESQDTIQDTQYSLTPADRAVRRLRVAVGRIEPLRPPALRPDPHAGAVFEVDVPVPEGGTAGNVQTVSSDLIKARMNG